MDLKISLSLKLKNWLEELDAEFDLELDQKTLAESLKQLEAES